MHESVSLLYLVTLLCTKLKWGNNHIKKGHSGAHILMNSIVGQTFRIPIYRYRHNRSQNNFNWRQYRFYLCLDITQRCQVMSRVCARRLRPSTDKLGTGANFIRAVLQIQRCVNRPQSLTVQYGTSLKGIQIDCNIDTVHYI